MIWGTMVADFQGEWAGCWDKRLGGGKLREGKGGGFTGNGVISTVVGPGATVAVAVVARHGGLGEEGEGLFEDCGDISSDSVGRRWRSSRA